MYNNNIQLYRFVYTVISLFFYTIRMMWQTLTIISEKYEKKTFHTFQTYCWNNINCNASEKKLSLLWFNTMALEYAFVFISMRSMLIFLKCFIFIKFIPCSFITLFRVVQTIDNTSVQKPLLRTNSIIFKN